MPWHQRRVLFFFFFFFFFCLIPFVLKPQNQIKDRNQSDSRRSKLKSCVIKKSNRLMTLYLYNAVIPRVIKSKYLIKIFILLINNKIKIFPKQKIYEFSHKFKFILRIVDSWFIISPSSYLLIKKLIIMLPWRYSGYQKIIIEPGLLLLIIVFLLNRYKLIYKVPPIKNHNGKIYYLNCQYSNYL